jgi:hypothetical protein
MLYSEIIAVCSQIHTKHTNTLCGQNVEKSNINMVVPILTTELQRVKYMYEYLMYSHARSFREFCTNFFNCSKGGKVERHMKLAVEKYWILI